MSQRSFWGVRAVGYDFVGSGYDAGKAAGVMCRGHVQQVVLLVELGSNVLLVELGSNVASKASTGRHVANEFDEDEAHRRCHVANEL